MQPYLLSQRYPISKNVQDNEQVLYDRRCHCLMKFSFQTITCVQVYGSL